jgi:hypothetical protein
MPSRGNRVVDDDSGLGVKEESVPTETGLL